MVTNKDKRPRPGWKVVALGAAATLIAFLAYAAILNDTFEIDQDATASNAIPGDDWDTLIANNGHAGGAFVFFNDPVGSAGDDNFAQGGSKDERDISAAGITKTFWNNTTQEPPDKDDIEDAFATSYTAANGDLLIYFGATRFSNNGDAAIGFWFFQDEIDDNNNGGTFDGTHTVGDILVTSDFRQGGGVGVINVFEWIGTAQGGPLRLLVSKTLGQNQAIPDVFCNDAINNFAANVVCATSNRAPKTVPANWPGGYSFKGSGQVTSFPTGTFFEGGVNITALFAGQTLPCFTSFLAMTRTSASTTAQLKDYALGSFPVCGISAGKACVVDATSPKVNADGVSIHTKFSVPITNTGTSPVHNISLVDNSLSDADNLNCTVTSINGTAANIALSATTPALITATLAAGATANVVVECNSLDNPMLNKITATASTSSTPGAGQVLSADHETSDEEQCAATVSPLMTVSKSCKTVTFKPATSPAGTFTLIPRVCVDIVVSNTGTEKLIEGSIVDDKLGTLTSTLQLNPGANTGATYLNQCYDGTAQDDPTNPNPGDAMFSDTVTVTARGALSGQVVDPAPFATAHCPLCPCVDCEE